MNDLAVQADLLELNTAIDNSFGDKTPKLNHKGEVRATDLPNEVDILDLPPPPDLFKGDKDLTVKPIELNKNSKKADLFTPEAMDEYLTAELLLPHRNTMQRAQVLRRHKEKSGLPIWRWDDDPILASRMYDTEFPDGSTEVVTASLITENLFSQVDEQGQQFQIMEEILDCGFTDKAVKPANGFTHSHNGQLKPVIITKVCELLVKWKDGSADWVPLQDPKVSNPVEVTECALAHKLDCKLQLVA